MATMTAVADGSFSLSKATDAEAHGTITFKVGGNTVETANQGDEVTIEVTPATGWGVAGVTAKAYASWSNTRSASSTEIPMLKDITVSGSGNTYTFTMPEANADITVTYTQKLIQDMAITLNPTGYEYDGTEKRPAVTVKDGDYTLVQGTDYSLAYRNNVYVGTATVTITGSGTTYGGSKEVTFPIWEPTYYVSSGTDGNGTVSVSPTWAEYGQEVTVSATPKEGYEVDQILVNGKPIDGNSFIYNFGDQVSVTFRLKQEPAPIVGDEKTIVDENGNRYTVKVTEVETNPETGEKVNDVIVTSVPDDVLNGKKEMQPTIINYAGNDYEVKTVAAEAFDKKAENVIIFLPEAAKTTAPVENVVNGDGTVEVLNLTPVTKFDAPREVKDRKSVV